MTRLTYLSLTVVLLGCEDSAVVLVPDSGSDATADVTVDAAPDVKNDVTQNDASDAGDATVPDDAGDAASDASAEADADAGCQTGFEYCNGTCVDVTTYQSDNKNCGFCGHDCQGNSCTAATCAPDTIGTGFANPSTLAVDSTTVYFATIGDGLAGSGEIYQCPVTGCPSKLGPMTSGQFNPESIAIDSNNVYWGNTGDLSMATGSVMSCPLANCGKNDGSRVTIVSSVQWVLGMALDSSNVYFGAWNSTIPANATVDSCPLAGCTAAPNEVLTGQSKPAFVRLDGSDIYMAQQGGGAGIPYVQTGTIPGPTSGTRLYTGSIQNQITGLAVFGGQFYFVDGFKGQIHMCPTSGCPSTLPLLTTTGTNPLALAVDSKGAYWIDDSGIEFCPLTGCTTPTLLATSANYPVDVALNGNYVYWVEQDSNGTAGQVMRVAR